MIWLLTRDGRNHYNLYSPATYGMSTWGGDYQEGLEKKRKYWYTYSWRAGNEYTDDEFYKCKLNVVLETTDISEVIRFLHDKKCKPELIRKILNAAQEEFNNFISFEKWSLKRD